MKHIVIDFKFDMVRFAQALSGTPIAFRGELAEIIGVDQSTLSNWIHEGAKGKYDFPLMRNFISACNWLDLDPRQFFVLDVPDFFAQDEPMKPPIKRIDYEDEDEDDTPNMPHRTIPRIPDDENGNLRHICKICGQHCGHIDMMGHCNSCAMVWRS